MPPSELDRLLEMYREPSIWRLKDYSEWRLKDYLTLVGTALVTLAIWAVFLVAVFPGGDFIIGAFGWGAEFVVAVTAGMFVAGIGCGVLLTAAAVCGFGYYFYRGIRRPN